MRLALAAIVLAAFLGTSATAAEPCGSVVLPSGLGMSALPGTAATLHPILEDGSLYEGQLSQMLYLPLLWYGGVDEIDWSKSLAASVTPNADDTAFTVTLKPWRWSDGVPITSADVLYAWDMIRKLGPAYSNYGVGGIPGTVSRVTAPDARTVVVTLNRRVNPDWFEGLGIAQLVPIPAHAWRRYSIAAQQTLQSTASFYKVADGPFLIRRLVLGREATFVPNPLYEGHRASIARLVVDFLQGTDPLQALRAHQVDAANIPATLLSAVSRLPDFRKIVISGAQNFDVLIPNMANRSKPFLADPRVRVAMAMSLDQKRDIALAHEGLGSPQYGLLSSNDGPLLPPELRDGHSPVAFDPGRANAILDAAGYRRGPDGIRSRNGVRLDLTILESAGNDNGLLLDQLNAADFRRVGIAMNIKQLEFNQLYAKMLGPSDGWDAVALGYSGGAYPDGTQMFLSTSQENFSHYRSATMDRLVEAEAGSADRDALFALERYIVAQQPMIFMGAGWPVLLVRPGLDGVTTMASPMATWSPEYLTLSGPMACDAPHA